MSRDGELLPDAERVSEQNARKVLERAIQIDSERAGDTTVGELRRVAQELNISPASLAQAFQEVHAITSVPPAEAAVPQKLSLANRVLGWVRTGGIIAAGLIGGLSTGGLSGNVGQAIVVLIVGSLALTVYDRRTKPGKSTLLDIAALFIAFLIGYGRQPTNPIGTNQISFWFIAIGGLVSLAASWLLSRVELNWFKDNSKQSFTTST